ERGGGVMEGVEVERAVKATREQPLELRGEHQPPAVYGEVQRLDAETVAPEHQPAGALVPQCEGEHAAQVADEVEAVLLVEVDQHLDVAPCPEEMPPRAEPGSQLAVVVDLAIADDAHRAVLVAHRLLPAGQVDDGEAPHPHDERTGGDQAAVIGSAMIERVAHRRCTGTGRGGDVAPIKVELSGNSTHRGLSSTQAAAGKRQ